MGYRAIFKHKLKQNEPASANAKQDARDGKNYAYDAQEEIPVRVNVALATGRPLLVRGPSGSGKSSLAASVAYIMDWNYYEFVVTSRTQARDLLWRFDTLQRLSDSQPRMPVTNTAQSEPARMAQLERYVEPGVLWWAFNPTTAAERGATSKIQDLADAFPPISSQQRGAARSVVLIDEIDKADPDVPNDLLVPLGSLQFDVEDTKARVTRQAGLEPPLIIITSNNERELPPAFLRRCVTLFLPEPKRERLKEIALSRRGNSQGNVAIYDALLDAMEEKTMSSNEGPPPSAAEYLDAIDACVELNVTPTQDNKIWNQIIRTTLFKQSPEPDQKP